MLPGNSSARICRFNDVVGSGWLFFFFIGCCVLLWPFLFKGLWVMNAEETSACGSISVTTPSEVAETDDSPVVLRLNLAVTLNGRINSLRCQHCLH